MERFPVSSSQILEIGYNKSTRILEIMFQRNKAIYQYAEVPSTVYYDLVHAESIGKFFNANVRDKFTFNKCVGPTCQWKGCTVELSSGVYCTEHAEEQANASTEEKDRREQETDDEEGPESACSPNTAHPDSGSSEV